MMTSLFELNDRYETIDALHRFAIGLDAIFFINSPRSQDRTSFPQNVKEFDRAIAL
jgi:hypothetical protein